MRNLAVLGFLASTGCYTHNISLNGAGVPDRSPDHKRWHHHVLAGLVNLSPDWKPNELCSNGAAFIRVDRGVIHYILGGITSSVYTPTIEMVWCEQGSASQSLPAEGLVHADVDAAVDLVVQDQQAEALDAL